MKHQEDSSTFRIRISILQKIIMLATALSLVTMGLYTYLAVKTESDVLTTGLIHTTRHISGDISSGAQSAFGSLNWVYVEKMLNESINCEQHGVIYSKIVKPDGEVYMANDRKYYGDMVDPSLLVEKEILLDNRFFPETKEYGVILVNPFQIGNERWYTIIGISLKSAKKAIRNLIILNLAWGSVILLLGIVLSYILFRSMSRPLVDLAESARIISNGDLDHKVAVKSKDEVGLLSHSFNHMIENLKRAKAELESSEKRYRTLIETASQVKMGIIVIQNNGEQKGVISFANQGFADLVGYTTQELAGMTIKEVIHPDSHDEAWGMYLKKPPEDKPHDTYQFWFMDRNGKKIPVETSIGLTEFNNRKGIVCYIKDITDKLEAEEQLKAYSQRLEAMVEDRTRDLEKTLSDLQTAQSKLLQSEKIAAIGTLAGGVAHDLNNILAGLVSYPELLLKEIPQDNPLRRSIETIYKSGQKAADIVQDLLTLARRGVVVTEIMDLNRIISDYLKSPEYARLYLNHPEVEVVVDLEPDLLHNIGSPVHLSKVVMNLVLNAAESMPHGGRVYISTENRYIDRPIKGYDDIEEGDYITFTVSDNGVGISQEDMERVFEPFYTKKVMGRSGTGLGMTVVLGAVKDHKGYIDIQSVQGKGTSISLYLPATREKMPKDESVVSIQDYMGKGESILVVDDVEEQREIAHQILKRLYYSVTLVSSGEEAVEYLKDNSADLIILDMVMDPGIDGLETYKRIIESHPGQKAIIVSGFSKTESIVEMQRLGAGKYIKKPYLFEKIGLAIRAEIDK